MAERGRGNFSSSPVEGVKSESSVPTGNAYDSLKHGFSDENRKDQCSFSFDGIIWEDATAPEQGGSAVGPLVCEPGWDFYDVLPDDKICADPFAESLAPLVLSVRRTLPIRLIRVYSEWPTTEPALGATLRPEGVTVASVSLPAIVTSLPRLLVAVCPPDTRLNVNFGAPRASSASGGVRSREDGNRKPYARKPAQQCLNSGSWAQSRVQTRTRWGDEGFRCSMPTDCQDGVNSLSAPALATEPPRSADSPRGRGRAPRAGNVRSLKGHAHAERFPLHGLGSPEDLLVGDSENVHVPMKVRKATAGVVDDSDSAMDVGQNASQAEMARLRGEVEDQRREKEFAEAQALRASKQADKYREECEQLTRKLRSSERAAMSFEMQIRGLQNALAEANSRLEAQRAAQRHGQPRQGLRFASPQSLDEVVASLVTIELQQLSACTSSQDRSATKKRLLLRWHPDKNSSNGGCGDLATRIVQEMQRRPEWNF